MKKQFILLFIFSLALVGVVSAIDWPICIDLVAPDAPSSLSLSGNVDLTWSEPSDFPECSSIKHYNIYRDGVEIDHVTGTSFSDGPLIDGTTYFYRVEAVDKAGNVGEFVEGSITVGSGGGNNNDGNGGGGSGGSGSSRSTGAVTADTTEEDGDEINLDDLSGNGDDIFSTDGSSNDITGAAITDTQSASLKTGIIILVIIIILGLILYYLFFNKSKGKKSKINWKFK
ncbi:fibronectin type III domain-containing protein [archaeon]|nr:fibronectin type III domain-containing protein [archaeon]